LLQRPPQHSASRAQTSPVCVQKDPPAAHAPLVQSFEQHSPFVAHALPRVRHSALSGVHVPPAAQVPLQH
jgi:hypothetical protein